jgi:hypothetical protein
MSDQNNTPPLPEVDVKFQIQALMEMVNFVMGGHMDRLKKVEKHGNEASTGWG